MAYTSSTIPQDSGFDMQIETKEDDIQINEEIIETTSGNSTQFVPKEKIQNMWYAHSFKIK